jgi:hypothetical protein
MPLIFLKEQVWTSVSLSLYQCLLLKKLYKQEGIALGEDDQFRYKRTVVVFST